MLSYKIVFSQKRSKKSVNVVLMCYIIRNHNLLYNLASPSELNSFVQNEFYHG